MKARWDVKKILNKTHCIRDEIKAFNGNVVSYHFQIEVKLFGAECSITNDYFTYCRFESNGLYLWKPFEKSYRVLSKKLSLRLEQLHNEYQQQNGGVE
jgi:hypothetical protein